MGLFSRSKPKIKVQSSQKDRFSGWKKCTSCEQLIHTKELEKNLQCCPKCGHHYHLSARERIAILVDKDSFEEMFTEVRAVDALQFVDSKPYGERLNAAQQKTGLTEGAIVGVAKLEEQVLAIGAIDFGFMGGSMGSVVGERLTRLIELGVERRIPVVIVSASGGARMQESVLSLMQMAKTSAALARLREGGLPFVSILTDPTSGGVTASFAALGDVIIAEPKALVCFTGPRVIEQTIGQKLPAGAQRSEFMLKHGMIDMIVPRQELRARLASVVGYLCAGLETAAKSRNVITGVPWMQQAHG